MVDSYDTDEFLALDALPVNPSHEGLVAQGWNWSFENAKSYVQKYGKLNIGQMYTTDTGDTRIYIHIDEDTPQNRLTFYVRFTSSVENNVDIDWGDGTVETKGNTTATSYPHTYATGGDYVIKLKGNTGTISFGEGTSSSSEQPIYGDRSDTYSYNRTRITQVEVGNGVISIGSDAFNECYSLASITIPASVESIGENAFSECRSLTSITIPDGVTSIEYGAFSYCYSLRSSAIPTSATSIGEEVFDCCYSLTSITIPDGVTSIGSYAFNDCRSLTSITIPDSVTSIDGAFSACYSLTSITIPDGVTSIDGGFSECYGMSEYHFLPTTPPTLADENTFGDIANDWKIYVPYSADHSILNAYKAAANWSTYASQIYEEAV